MREIDWRRFRIAGFDMTAHAGKRMVEMGVTVEEVRDCLTDWENRYGQEDYGPGSFIYQRGPIAVATNESDGARVIKSVLWRTQREYRRPGE